MIDNQQLFKQIPKHVSQWTKEDVLKWFKINEIQLSTEIALSGQDFLKLTPKKIAQDLKLSHFLTRKISDWIQNEVPQFQQFLQAKIQYNQLNQNQTVFQSIQKYTNSISQQQQFFQPNMQIYKSQELINNLNQNKLKNQKSNSCSKILIIQEDQAQIYSAKKYKLQKNYEKKKKFFQKEIQVEKLHKEKQSLRKPSLRKQLILKDLNQNEGLIIQDTQTQQTKQCIPQNANHSQNNSHNSSQISFQQQKFSSDNEVYENNVKFITSKLMVGDQLILFAQYQYNIHQITGYTKVGRSNVNDIMLKNQGVSRNHAQIIVTQQKNQHGGTYNRYFLKDLNSKFGTFVEIDPQKPKKVQQGETFCIGETCLKIQKLKISNLKDKFDISINIILNQQQIKTYVSKSILTIGCKRKDHHKQQKSSQVTKRGHKQKERKDLQIDDITVKNYHCRFTIINGSVYLQQVQGNIFEKISPNQLFELQRKQYSVKFGDENITLRFDYVNGLLKDLNS